MPNLTTALVAELIGVREDALRRLRERGTLPRGCVGRGLPSWSTLDTVAAAVVGEYERQRPFLPVPFNAAPVSILQPVLHCIVHGGAAAPMHLEIAYVSGSPTAAGSYLTLPASIVEAGGYRHRLEPGQLVHRAVSRVMEQLASAEDAMRSLAERAHWANTAEASP